MRSDSLNKVVNLSGLSSLSFDTYNVADGVYKKDFFYDISNASSYTRNTFFQGIYELIIYGFKGP